MTETARPDERADEDRTPPRVAVVLSGAVARGAFQAGALGSVLSALKAMTPSLEPSIMIGSSAGAINTALWVKALEQLGAGTDPDTVAEHVRNIWLSMGAEQIFEPPVSWSPTEMCASLTRVGWPALRGFVRGGSGIDSLLDTTPLHHKAGELLDAPLSLPRQGLDTIGVVGTWVPPADTTGSASGRSTLFLQERDPTEWAGDATRALDVVRTAITKAHVLASCAVPVAFPAEHVGDAGWYVDGGVRLNTPLLPAIALGATHIVVISAMSLGYADRVPNGHEPHLIDAASQVMHALIADRAVEDLLELQKTNRLVDEARGHGVSLTSADGRRPYKTIRVLTIAPRPGELRAIAQRFWAAKYSSGTALLRLEDNAVLGRLLRTAGDDASFSELLSYVLFDTDYFADSYRAGRAAAEAALAHPRESGQTPPWRVLDILRTAEPSEATTSRIGTQENRE